MTAHSLVTRRILLRDMGRAGLAIVVFGAAACSSDETGDPNTTVGGTTDSPPSTGGAGETTSTSGSSSTTGGTASGGDWHRVDLGFVSAYLLYRNGEAALVDTGVEGSAGDIEAALGEIGLGWDSVGHLIVTHQHPDHQGSVDAVLSASEAPWYAGQGDIGAITAAVEGTVVGDGDTVFDLTVIDTPGHTPGHISVLDPAAGILVAGDALNGADGGVAGANPDFSDDMDAANGSVLKLAGFDYEVALFGHGEPVLEAASDRVGDLANSLSDS